MEDNEEVEYLSTIKRKILISNREDSNMNELYSFILESSKYNQRVVLKNKYVLDCFLRSKIDILVKGAIICLFYRLSIKELIYKDDLVSVINGIYHSDDTKKSAITSLGFLFESSRDINILLFLYEIYNSEFAGYFLRLHAFKELLSVYFERSIHSNSSIIVECVDMDIYEILSFHEERFKLEFEEIIKFIHIDKNASLLKMLGWEI